MPSSCASARSMVLERLRGEEAETARRHSISGRSGPDRPGSVRSLRRIKNERPTDERTGPRQNKIDVVFPRVQQHQERAVELGVAGDSDVTLTGFTPE